MNRNSLATSRTTGECYDIQLNNIFLFLLTVINSKCKYHCNYSKIIACVIFRSHPLIKWVVKIIPFNGMLKSFQNNFFNQMI